MSAIRPLSAHPSLEHDRKEAKALLKLLHAGDPGALQRASEHVARSTQRTTQTWALADAQRIIAREYGLPNWPRLVAYLADLERHRHAPRHNRVDQPVEQLEQMAQRVLRSHAHRDHYVARELAQYVPHCYGRSFDDVFAATITLDDARMVVARRNRCASWDALLENVTATAQWQQQRRWEAASSALQRARAAIRSSDASALTAVLDAHPDVVIPSEVDRAYRATLARVALHVEHTSPTPAARQVTELLASRGADVQHELDAELLGWWPMQEGGVARVRWMLERGANPHWTPPNRISVLEHAIVRFRDAACVDLIAANVTPKPALWIAAGLGDVEGVRQFVAGKGKLTPSGRRNRPDLIAMGVVFGAMAVRHDADDLEVMWEAFRIAGWNHRWHTMDALLEAGLPIDHAPLGMPVLMEAVSNFHLGTAPLAEYLISRSADLDRDWGPRHGGSARAALRASVQNLADPRDPQVRRMLELCGAGTVAEILVARDDGPTEPLSQHPATQRALQLAADDAAALGASAVSTEHLLVGWLRVYAGGLADLFVGRDVDMASLRTRIGDRLRPDRDPLAGGELPLDEQATAAVRVATELAEALRSEAVHPHQLLYGILRQETGPGSRLLHDVGVTDTTFGVGFKDLRN